MCILLNSVLKWEFRWIFRVHQLCVVSQIKDDLSAQFPHVLSNIWHTQLHEILWKTTRPQATNNLEENDPTSSVETNKTTKIVGFCIEALISWMIRAWFYFSFIARLKVIITIDDVRIKGKRDIDHSLQQLWQSRMMQWWKKLIKYVQVSDSPQCSKYSNVCQDQIEKA